MFKRFFKSNECEEEINQDLIEKCEKLEKELEQQKILFSEQSLEQKKILLDGVSQLESKVSKLEQNNLILEKENKNLKSKCDMFKSEQDTSSNNKLNEEKKNLEKINLEFKIQNQKLINECRKLEYDLSHQKKILKEELNKKEKELNIKLEEYKKEAKNNDKDLPDDILLFKNENNKLKEQYRKLSKELNHQRIVLREKEIELNEKQRLYNKERLKNIELNKHELNREIKFKEKEYVSFEKEKKIYDLYLTLSENNKKALTSIFRENNFKSFLWSGIQYKSIDFLWEFIKRNIMSNKIEDLNKLSEIFNFFLSEHNKVYGKVIYALQNVKIGEEFSEDEFVKTSNSNESGNIQSIYLKGYVNKSINKIVKKSVVKI